jgi:hypothetical protein
VGTLHVWGKFIIKINGNKLRLTVAHVTVLPVSFLVLYGLIISVANDVPNYEHIWEISQIWSFIEVFNQRRIEFGSLFILWYFANYFSAITMIFFTGAIALFAKYYLFNKYINQTFIAYLLYVVTFVHILDANQIRAALASCFLIYAILSPPKSKYTYLILAAFGVIFHYSAVIIISLYFVRLKYVLIFLVIIASLSFDYIVISHPALSFANVWLSGGDGHVSFINSFWIMQVLITILCVFNWKQLSEGQKRGALLNILGTVVYISFFASPIIAHRIRELSQLGIFAILFLGPQRLSAVKLGTSLCFAYIVGYNMLLIALELISIQGIKF